MERLEYFLWLAEQAGNNPLFLWPAALLLLGAFIAASADGLFFSRLLRARPLLLAPLAAAVLMLFCGTVFEHHHCSPEMQRRAGTLVFGLLVSQSPVAIGLVVMLRDIRAFTAFLVLLQLWYCCLAAFVSSMSITGTWL